MYSIGELVLLMKLPLEPFLKNQSIVERLPVMLIIYGAISIPWDVNGVW